MPTLEERVAELEGRMKPDLREEMLRGFDRMRDEMARGAEQLRAEMTQLRADVVRGFERTESRFERVDDRMYRQFTWIVGIQLTTMLTVIGVLAAAYFR